MQNLPTWTVRLVAALPVIALVIYGAFRLSALLADMRGAV